MLPALGALGALSGLLSALDSSSKSTTRNTSFSNPFETSSSSTSSPFRSVGSSGSDSFPSLGLSSDTMKALLMAQSASTAGSSSTADKSRDAALKDLLALLDGNSDGAISKSEFETALGAGGTNLDNADKVFAALDTDGDGSVSAKELAAALTPRKKQQHDDVRQAGGRGGSGDPLLQALDGASSTSVSNSDGSVTTSISYADGSKVTMTSAATSSASSNATSSYNFVEQLIQRQAAQLQAAASSTLSVSA
jgi:hypothetical protein